eukprot:751980-Hanusia_phi.AAC.3
MLALLYLLILFSSVSFPVSELSRSPPSSFIPYPAFPLSHTPLLLTLEQILRSPYLSYVYDDILRATTSQLTLLSPSAILANEVDLLSAAQAA